MINFREEKKKYTVIAFAKIFPLFSRHFFSISVHIYISTFFSKKLDSTV